MKMKYTIELTDKQKKVMDCLVEIIHRYIGFNPKFEMYREPEVITKTVTDPNADAIYEQGFEDGKKESNEEHEEYIRDLVNKAKQEGYDIGLEIGKNEAIHNTELIPELKKCNYTLGYDEALEDVNNLIAFFDRNFMYECYPEEYKEYYSLYDLNAKYGLAEILEKWKAYTKQKKAEEESIKVGDEVIITGLKDEETKGVIYQLGKDRAICLVGNSGLANIGKKDMTKTGRHFDQVEQILSELKGEK